MKMKRTYKLSDSSGFFVRYLFKIYRGILRYIVYAYFGFFVFLNLIILTQTLISADFISNAVLGNIISMLFISLFAPFEGLWSIVTNNAYSFHGSGFWPLIGAVSTWVVIIDSVRLIGRKNMDKKVGVG